MTDIDIRIRLVDALRDQFRAPPLQLDYAAGVLLSLPGIAITELPPPTSPISTMIKRGMVTNGRCYPSCFQTVEIRSAIGISIADARALAAALLAAANAAEQATK